MVSTNRVRRSGKLRGNPKKKALYTIPLFFFLAFFRFALPILSRRCYYLNAWNRLPSTSLNGISGNLIKEISFLKLLIPALRSFLASPFRPSQIFSRSFWIKLRSHFSATSPSSRLFTKFLRTSSSNNSHGNRSFPHIAL